MESSVIITCLVVLGNSKGNEVVLGFVKKAQLSAFQGWPLQFVVALKLHCCVYCNHEVPSEQLFLDLFNVGYMN